MGRAWCWQLCEALVGSMGAGTAAAGGVTAGACVSQPACAGNGALLLAACHRGADAGIRAVRGGSPAKEFQPGITNEGSSAESRQLAPRSATSPTCTPSTLCCT